MTRRVPSMRRNILITGASSGLGAGMARLYAARGHNLALCARRTDRLELLANELRSAYPDVTVLIQALDVNDHDLVFEVFRGFDASLGGLDRIIVNAGVGNGAPVGTGKFSTNQQIATTNFVGALAQCEAAMEIFRRRNAGHLVLVSSVSAVRGLPKTKTTYAATKAGVAALAEGIRADVLGTPIVVSTMFPGYIRSELTDKGPYPRFMVDTETGCKALVSAIDAEPAGAFVPRWPWRPLALALRLAPLRVIRWIV